MQNVVKTSLLLLAGGMASGCPAGLDRDQLAVMTARCEAERVVSGIRFTLVNFSRAQLDGIEAIEEIRGAWVRSHPVIVDTDGFANLNAANVAGPIHREATLVIRIPGERPHRISELHVGLVRRQAMMSHLWQCALQSMKVDGLEVAEGGVRILRAGKEEQRK